MYLFIEHEKPLLDYESVENDSNSDMMEPYAQEGEDYSETDGEQADIEEALDDEVTAEIEKEIEEEIEEKAEEEKVEEEDDFDFDDGEETDSFDFDFE